VEKNGALKGGISDMEGGEGGFSVFHARQKVRVTAQKNAGKGGGEREEPARWGGETDSWLLVQGVGKKGIQTGKKQPWKLHEKNTIKKTY